MEKAKESKNVFYESIALLSLGDMFYKLNQYEKARDYFEQVVKTAQQTKNRWILGIANNGVGSVFSDVNSNSKAQASLEQSLALMKDVLDRNGEGGVLNTLGVTYLNLKDYDKAQKYFEDARAIAKELKNKQSEVFPLVNLGEVFQKKNQMDKAQSFYNQGLNLAKEVKDRSNEGFARNGLGVVCFKNKKYKEAEDFYRQSLAIAKEVQSKKLEASVLQNLMDLHNELKKPQLAVVYGKQAVNIFQQIRGNIKSFEKESQQSYVKDKETAYRTLADLLVAQERFPEAQAVLNLLKDEEFSQLARDGEKSEVVPYSDIEARLLELSEKLADWQAKYDELQKIENPTDEQKQQSADLRVQLDGANKAFDAALKDLEKAEKSVVEPVDSFLKNENLQGALTDLREMSGSGAVALYTLVGREETAEIKDARDEKTKFGWVIMITEKGRQAYPIDVKNFNETVFQFKDALSSDRYDPRPVAQKLYNAIFRQKSARRKRTLEQDLQEYLAPYQNKTVMWSLDGVLRYVPMAALHDGKNYLVEKYQNTVFTEKSIISLVKENRKNWKILGLGVSEARENFAALPGVKVELETIVREENSPTGILNGAIKLNGNFTRDSFFRTLGRGEFPVVHIASHYSFKPAAQAESFLLLGDGHLVFGELKEKNLFGAVDLLTLSACETGTTGNGKEAEGFPVKAQELGAKAVIASLWKVSDAGTPELMIRFYKLRNENLQMSKGEAFRQAQLSLLGAENKVDLPAAAVNRSTVVSLNGKKMELPLFVKDEKKPFAHPHYWSSFVLIGNWR